MNKPTLPFARYFRAAVLALFMASSLVQAAPPDNDGRVKSLRSVDVNAQSPESEGIRYQRDRPPLPRDFVQQPPLIPHTIEGYTVNLNFNKCMDCHAWNRAKESGATKISVTHFRTRDGQELSSVSPQRYFCNQCHVPQSDAQALVGNTFKPAAGMR